MLGVHLGPRPVGWIEIEAGRSTFVFDQRYVDGNDATVRPVLGQWFEDRIGRTARAFTTSVPPWFENLLPELGGRVRVRLARELRCAEEDDEALLLALGSDLPGAVIVTEGGAAPGAADVVPEGLPDLSPALRSSLGGMQLKFTLSGGPGRLTLPVRNEAGERWILKVAEETAYPRLAQNEAAVSNWLRAAGFDVPEVHVIPRDAFPNLGALSTETRWGFLIRRYDRTVGGRVHQEDFLQVLGRPRRAKYEATHALGLGRLVRQILGAGERGVREYIRRTVAVVATGNGDAHLKNWSLLYPDGVGAAFAPLYDQVATIAYRDLDGRLALRVGNAQDFGEVTIDAVRFVGDRLGVDDVPSLVDETLVGLSRAFDPDALGFDPSLADALVDHWRRVPLLRPHALRTPPAATPGSRRRRR